MKKILLVEDNDAIIKGLKYTLEQEGFLVTVSKYANESKAIINRNEFDLVILDITLPDGSGYDVCKLIKMTKKTPVIFLTAKEEENDIVKGFDLGADDYIIKPFKPRELISRMNRLLKDTQNKNIITCQNVTIDLDSAKVLVDDKIVAFSALEYKLLVVLFSNIDKIITREKLLDKIWDEAGNFVNDNTLTVYIKRLREKIGNDNLITTIKGMGYRVESSNENI